jgi:hypothetical protein
MVHIRQMSNNRTPVSVIVAAIIIAISATFLFRWHVISSEARVVRVDRWTGKIQICSQPSTKIVCVEE